MERVWVVGAAVRRREVDGERARKLGATFKDKVTFYIQKRQINGILTEPINM